MVAKIPTNAIGDLTTIKVNTINETTSGNGVTIDSLSIKDQEVVNWVGAAAQVVGASVTGAVSVTSTTYTDTGATVTITPQYATSKILVWARGCFSMGKGHDTTYAGIKLVRNVNGGSFSNLVTPQADTNGPYEIGREEAGTGENITVWANYYNYVFLDDPDTTTACIYKLQARPYDASDSQYIAFGNTGGGGGGQSQQMVVMEILHGS